MIKLNFEQKLEELGHKLPPAPAKGGVYMPCKEFGANLAYVSGCGPAIGDETYQGKVGRDLSFEDGRKAALNCTLNMLAVVKQNLGSLDRIKRIVKLLVFVSCADDFYMQPQVANTSTELLVAVFGEAAGCPSRSAVGANALPGNISVEIEMLIELN